MLRELGQHLLLLDIETNVAQRDACSFSCSNAIRTARSLTSGEYRYTLLILQSSQEMESPEIPGGSVQLICVFLGTIGLAVFG